MVICGPFWGFFFFFDFLTPPVRSFERSIHAFLTLCSRALASPPHFPLSDLGANLISCPQIIGLHLENTNITDASLRAIVQCAPMIRVLDLSKCAQISERGLINAFEHCKELRYLGLRDVTAVTDSVVCVAMALPHLLRLDLDGAHRLTDQLVAPVRGSISSASSMSSSAPVLHMPNRAAPSAPATPAARFAPPHPSSVGPAPGGSPPLARKLSLSSASPSMNGPVVVSLRSSGPAKELSQSNDSLYAQPHGSTSSPALRSSPPARILATPIRGQTVPSSSSAASSPATSPSPQADIHAMRPVAVVEPSRQTQSPFSGVSSTVYPVVLAAPTPIRHSPAVSVAPVSSLEELSFAGVPLSARALSVFISRSPLLTSLNLSFCAQITDNALEAIVRACPHLDSLALRQTTSLTDAFLPAMANLGTLSLLENPQLSLPAIRKLVSSESSRVKVFGADIDITLLRNAMPRPPFTVTINEFEPAQTLLAHISHKLEEEDASVASAFKLRRVTYRKNGTRRPGLAHPESEYANLVRELVEKKHHMYLDQNPTSVLRIAGAPQANDLFLTLRLWDSKTGRPQDLRDVSLPSTMTLADLKQHLHNEGSLPLPPERMFVVEEETDLRTNILATDAMSISMCGIISGDILHFEEITEEKLDTNTQQIVHSWTGSYLASRPVLLSIQETDESFHRRRGKLTFLQEGAFKFELKLKSGWSFSKLRHRIARRVGVAPEYLRLSTRVEPQAHLSGASTQTAIEAIGGNLWLLLDIDCAEMLSEKLPVVIHHYNRAGLCASVQTILVRKSATLKQLKEKVAESLRIPEELQLISRLSSREVAAAGMNSVSVANAMASNPHVVQFAMQTPLFVRQVYLHNYLKLSQLNLHHVRVDEMERPVADTDLILQTVQFAGWKSAAFKSSATTHGPVRLVALPAGSKFNDVKAAIASNHNTTIDVDTMSLKLASSNGLQRGLMFDIRPKYYQDHSRVVASTILRPLDIVCWNDTEF